MKRRKDQDDHHPSQSNSTRFPQDQILRFHGYKIEHRRKDQEAVWKAPDGSTLTFTDALSQIARKSAQKTCEGR